MADEHSEPGGMKVLRLYADALGESRFETTTPRHLNCAASGALVSASRAASKASTFTPLLTELAFGHRCLRTLGCLSGRDCIRLDLSH
jgi:hypothetical protein